LNKAADTGIKAKLYKFNSSVTQTRLLQEINKLNNDPTTHGTIPPLSKTNNSLLILKS
jgi:5,10-methylene-tetrahydrofolate dehydrogenase/methenyl tetrahydrofolate cyclohydrolase